MSLPPKAKKVLVIEDEKPIRSILIAFLSSADFETVEAENGMIGLDLARKEKPDLIICDVNMPQLDGYGVLAELRQDPLTSAIPFIFLTGKTESSDLRAGMNLGADDYLTKPFKRSDLLKAIDARLSKQAAIAHHYNAEIQQAEERLNHLIHYDTLTNLPNRLMLRQKLNEMLIQVSPHHQVAILSIGLDRFKRVNHTLGYEAGDELLKQVAGRLNGCVSAKDTVARLNADQFAILLSDITSDQKIKQTTTVILESFNHPFDVNGYGVFTTVSVGISLYPDHGSDIDQLIKNAEVVMQHVKKRGGNGYDLFAPDRHQESVHQMELEGSLQIALEQNQFEVFYQPQVDLRSGKITGAEALIRWKHPERGLISPGVFIPLAEECGLIVRIGEWVLRQASMQARKWQDAGFPLVVAVNISGEQFNQQNLTERLIQILRETNLDPAFLDLELTESILMKDAQAAILMLSELKELGIKVSVDDFGTGYSSLSYLKRFPFDSLKIDQTFIRNITVDSKNAAITMAIIEMAHSLNLKVIAEGVETPGELFFLSLHDCDCMQGYLFSRPLPVEEFEKILFSDKRLQSVKG